MVGLSLSRLSLGLASGTGGGVPSLSSWFADGGDGQLYDFTKTDRFFQDINGQTLADDVGEAIGLVLDQHSWGGQTLAAYIPTIASMLITKDLTLWTFTNASGIASCTATTLSLRGASDNIYKAGHTANIGNVFEAACQMSGTGKIRVGGLSGSGGIVNLTEVTLTGTPTWYRVRFGSSASGSNAGVTLQGAADGSSVDLTMHDIALYKIAGNHGLQATGTLKGVRQTTGIKFDGTDDNLLTNYLAQAGANSIVALVTVPASIPVTQVIVGSSLAAAANPIWIGFTTGGVVRSNIGAIVDGTTDVRGMELVVGVSYDGTTRRIFVGANEEASNTTGGTVNNTVPFRIASVNVNGTAANFFSGSIKKLAVLRRSLTLTEYLQIRAAMLAS